MEQNEMNSQPPKRTLPSSDVEVDESGFLCDALEWTPEIAEQIARECGLSMLGPRHWRVLLCCREEVAREGLAPDLASVARLTRLPLAELDLLFGHRAFDLLPRIAGLPRPAKSTKVK